MLIMYSMQTKHIWLSSEYKKNVWKIYIIYKSRIIYMLVEDAYVTHEKERKIKSILLDNKK